MVRPLQFTHEGLRRKTELEGSFSFLRLHMIDDVLTLPEGLGAQMVSIRSLAGTNVEVNLQTATFCEGLAAVGATVRLIGVRRFGREYSAERSLAQFSHLTATS